ncbi:MAG: serine/threonine protein kinase [Planctomycetes bacterium]|nr:serine/threonine protein kinase [Planctomycetota bacterium]
MLEYPDGYHFRIAPAGDRIVARWPDDATFEDASCYLLGPVLRFVLGLRGVPCLHASAVDVDGGAIALAGESGAGKSTTAAALVRAGARLLTDDTVTLVRSGEDVVVHPGYAGLRLWPDVTAALGGPGVELPRVSPGWDKRFLAAEGRAFDLRPVPLRAIYLLGDRRTAGAPCIEALSARDRLLALLQHVREEGAKGRAGWARAFEALAALIERIPVRRLIPHADLDRLPALVDLVLTEARRPDGPEV